MDQMIKNNNIPNKIKCKECNKLFWRITNTHLWKEHQMTIDDYREKHPGALVEDVIISKARQDSKRGKTYEEIFGKEECMRCGATEKIIVHHKDFLNDNSVYGNHDLDNLMVLCKSCYGKLHNEYKRGSFTGIPLIEKGAIYMLKGLHKEFGLDLNDVNFKDTPKRISRAFYEIFEGINAKDQIEEILNTSFPTKYDGMIIESIIRCYSMCPHHFLPVIYDVSIGYIPRKGGIGLSKLPRLIELLAKAPKLQEDFTKEIVSVLDKSIKPLGCIVQVKGEHLCMQMRGVKKPGCTTTTCSFSGTFKEPATRKEFYDTVNREVH